MLRQGYGPMAALSVSQCLHPQVWEQAGGEAVLRSLGTPHQPFTSRTLATDRPAARLRAPHCRALNLTYPAPAPTSAQVPDAALPKAEALAYSEFPDEGQLPLYSSSLAAAQHCGGGGGLVAAAHRPGSCLRLARRLSSPRQFGHRPMAGARGCWGCWGSVC